MVREGGSTFAEPAGADRSRLTKKKSILKLCVEERGEAATYPHQPCWVGAWLLVACEWVLFGEIDDFKRAMSILWVGPKSQTWPLT